MTEKIKSFCREFTKDFNGAQAAVRAGYSSKTAKEQAARLLTKVNVKKLISELQKEISNRNEISADYLRTEFKFIANDDLMNYVDFKTTALGTKIFLKKDFNKLNTKNIQKLSMKDGYLASISLYSRDNALLQLGRHVGFFNDEITLKTNLEGVLASLSESNKLSDEHLLKMATMIFEQQKKFLNEKRS